MVGIALGCLFFFFFVFFTALPVAPRPAFTPCTRPRSASDSFWLFSLLLLLILSGELVGVGLRIGMILVSSRLTFSVPVISESGFGRSVALLGVSTPWIEVTLLRRTPGSMEPMVDSVGCDPMLMMRCWYVFFLRDLFLPRMNL